MERMIKKYERKLVPQGLCDEGAPLFAGVDADMAWNRDGAEMIFLRGSLTV